MSLAHGTPVELAQDCDVTLIPSGQTTTLKAGEKIMVTQALGGTLTVQTATGQLARISPEDAQTLGLADEAGDPKSSPWGPFEYKQVIEQLKTVFDPEIPVNIVDLGLIYACDARVQADGSYRGRHKDVDDRPRVRDGRHSPTRRAFPGPDRARRKRGRRRSRLGPALGPEPPQRHRPPRTRTVLTARHRPH
jgi:hypothetical protein